MAVAWIVLLIVILVGGTACGEVSYDPQTGDTTFEQARVQKPVAQEPR